MKRIKYFIAATLLVFSLLLKQEEHEERVMSSSYTYKKYVAITFDDGPHKEYTEILLEGLKQRNVKATFFLVGKNIEGNEELVRRMYEEGHSIGNHTYSHIDLKTVNRIKAVEELNKTSELIYKITGIKPRYIRPPFGTVYKEASINDMTVVMWSVDTRDWEGLNADTIVNNVVDNAKDGDIILLHDIFLESVSAAFKIIDKLQQMGFEFVTVEDLIIE